jgi:radical SAM superfamily enzyme YgiQ (UPF0313 family)
MWISGKTTEIFCGILMHNLVVLAACAWKDTGSEKTEHLGLATLSSYLFSRNIRVKIIDGNFTEKSYKDIVDEILKTRCRIAGFSVTRPNLEESMKAATLLRDRNDKIHITFGGHEPTLNYIRILKSCGAVDSIVMGEGELTLTELCKRIISGRQWRNIEGIALRDNTGTPCKNPPRHSIEDLDVSPFPDRKIYGYLLRNRGTASLYSSRGCFGNCSYCGINLFYRETPGRRWRARSAENVVDEIEFLTKKYRVKTILFKDDDFIGPGRRGRDRAQSIGAEILKRGLDINFSFLCRPDTLDIELLKFLMKAGLFHVSLGVESWNPRQLDLYNKGITPDVNDRAVSLLEEIGLDYTIYLLLFDPYLTVEELLEQVDKIEHVGVEHIFFNNIFNRLRLSPMSPLHAKFRKDNLRSFEKCAGIPVQTLYEFVHPETAAAYQFWEKLQPIYTEGFNSHYNKLDSPDMLYEKMFLKELDILLRKWILTRYRNFLKELISRKRKSYDRIINKHSSVIEKKIRYIQRKLKALTNGDECRIGIELDGEVMRFPFEKTPEFVKYLEFLMRVRGKSPERSGGF